MMTTFDKINEFHQRKSEREHPKNASAASHLRYSSVVKISPDRFSMIWKKNLDLDGKTPMIDKLMQFLFKPGSSAYDVRIQIDKEEYEAPLMILQCYSEFFQSKKARKTIKLQSFKIGTDIFGKIAEWMLDPSKKVERKDMIPILKAAKYLKIGYLETQILRIVEDSQKFQENEALMLYLEANYFDCQDIKSLMITRVQKFFLSFVSFEEFVQLSGVEVENWLQLDSIEVNTEIEVFYAACRWLLHDWENRKNSLTQLMKCVRFGLAEPWRIVELRMVKKERGKLSEILKNFDLQETLEKSLSYATYRNCFPEDDSEKFNDFLQRFGYEKLKSRTVMQDPTFDANYKDIRYSFNDFEEYLKNLRTGASSWKPNAISKKETVIHDLCDCDSLEESFSKGEVWINTINYLAKSISDTSDGSDWAQLQ